MWIARNPTGGMLFTKSPNGIVVESFLPPVGGVVGAIDHDGPQQQHHAHQDDEVRAVLPGGEAGRDSGLRQDAVREDVEAEPDRHHECPQPAHPREPSSHALRPPVVEWPISNGRYLYKSPSHPSSPSSRRTTKLLAEDAPASAPRF